MPPAAVTHPFHLCEWIAVYPHGILRPEAVATPSPHSPSSFAFLLSFISEIIISLARMSILIKAYKMFSCQNIHTKTLLTPREGGHHA